MYGYVLKGSKAVHFQGLSSIYSRYEYVPQKIEKVWYCTSHGRDSELKTDLLSADFISLGSGGFLHEIFGGFGPREHWLIIFFPPHKQKYKTTKILYMYSMCCINYVYKSILYGQRLGRQAITT